MFDQHFRSLGVALGKGVAIMGEGGGSSGQIGYIELNAWGGGFRQVPSGFYLWYLKVLCDIHWILV